MKVMSYNLSGESYKQHISRTKSHGQEGKHKVSVCVRCPYLAWPMLENNAQTKSRREVKVLKVTAFLKKSTKNFVR